MRGGLPGICRPGRLSRGTCGGCGGRLTIRDTTGKDNH
jgi:hypothetical protein